MEKKPEMPAPMCELDVLRLWNSLIESRVWGPVGPIRRCVEFPNLVMVGADEEHGGETYAVLDMQERRVIGKGELKDTTRYGWKPLRVMWREPARRMNEPLEQLSREDQQELAHVMCSAALNELPMHHRSQLPERYEEYLRVALEQWMDQACSQAYAIALARTGWRPE